MLNPSRSRLDVWLGWAQVLTLGGLIFLSVISRPRQMLLEVSSQQNIPLEFRIVSLSIADMAVLVLLALTLVRLLGAAVYRQQLFETANVILTRLGGIWWAGLVVWTMIGLLWAHNDTMLRFSMVHLVAVLALAIIVADVVRERRDRWLLGALLVSAVVQSAIGVLQVLNNGPLGWWALGEIDRFSYDPTDFYRAPGLAMHYNYLAGYLMVALFATGLVGWRRWQARQSIIVPVVVAMVISVGMVSTLSRSALVGTAAGLLPLMLVVLRRVPPHTRRVILGVLGAGVIAAGLWALFALGSIANIQTRFLTGREFFFDYSWAVIQQSPVLGVGAGNLMLEAGTLWGLDVINLLPVHNVYLFIWAEQGLPGLALFVIGCGVILWRLRRTDQPEMLIWSACFLAICTVNLFDNYFWAVHPFRVVFFWVIGLGWAYAYPLAANEPDEPQTSTPA